MTRKDIFLICSLFSYLSNLLIFNSSNLRDPLIAFQEVIHYFSFKSDEGSTSLPHIHLQIKTNIASTSNKSGLNTLGRSSSASLPFKQKCSVKWDFIFVNSFDPHNVHGPGAVYSIPFNYSSTKNGNEVQRVSLNFLTASTATGVITQVDEGRTLYNTLFSILALYTKGIFREKQQELSNVAQKLLKQSQVRENVDLSERCKFRACSSALFSQPTCQNL